MSTTNTIRRRSFLAATLAATAAGAAGCGFSGDDGGGGRQRGGTLRQSMLPVAHMDPAVAGGASYAHIIMRGLMEGLVVPDPEGTDVLPAAAEAWTVSDDLLTYTFTIRSDARWSNGEPVTAQDFEWNWRRVLTPGIAGEGAPSYQPAARVVNAVAYMNQEIDDFDEVGVKALDDVTLEFVLEVPNPMFLFLVGTFRHFPLHPATVEEHGDAWADPANWVSNGAYVLEDFRVNQGAVLLPNEQYWDKVSYYLDRWEVRFNDAGTPADLLSFQNDDIDITGRIEDDLQAVTTSNVAGELVTSPTTQMRQLIVMNSRNPALHDVRVRKALAMAIDREALAEVARPDVAGVSWLPEAVPETGEIQAIPFDVEGARSLLADAGYPDGEGMPTIALLDFQTSPWVEAMGEMWRLNLGIDSAVDIVEIGVYGTKRRELHDESYTGFVVWNTGVQPPTLYNAVRSRQPSPVGNGVTGLNLVPPEVAEQFLQMQEDGATPGELNALLNENRYPEAQRFLELSGEALTEVNPDTQLERLLEAAIAMDETFVEIPVLWGGYNLLIKPRIKDLQLEPDTSVFSTKGIYIDQEA